MSCRHEFDMCGPGSQQRQPEMWVTLLITVVSDDDLFQLDRAHGHSFVGDGERVPKRVERLVHRHF